MFCILWILSWSPHFALWTYFNECCDLLCRFGRMLLCVDVGWECVRVFFKELLLFTVSLRMNLINLFFWQIIHADDCVCLVFLLYHMYMSEVNGVCVCEHMLDRGHNCLCFKRVTDKYFDWPEINNNNNSENIPKQCSIVIFKSCFQFHAQSLASLLQNFHSTTSSSLSPSKQCGMMTLFFKLKIVYWIVEWTKSE